MSKQQQRLKTQGMECGANNKHPGLACSFAKPKLSPDQCMRGNRPGMPVAHGTADTVLVAYQLARMNCVLETEFADYLAGAPPPFAEARARMFFGEGKSLSRIRRTGCSMRRAIIMPPPMDPKRYAALYNSQPCTLPDFAPNAALAQSWIGICQR